MSIATASGIETNSPRPKPGLGTSLQKPLGRHVIQAVSCGSPSSVATISATGTEDDHSGIEGGCERREQWVVG